MDKIQKMMTEMFELQNTLNNQTNGEQWVDGFTKEGRKINWNRCIYMETAELIDSFPSWKHWKDINAPHDLDNAKVEIVDIWHFVMSRKIEQYHNVFSIDKIAEIIKQRYDDAILDSSWKYKSIVQLAEKILKNAVNDEDVTNDFFHIVEAIDDFTMEDVYRLYIGKNCLNQFRQDNGYKDGTYKKLWDGKEDNVHMQSIMEQNPDIGYKDLYTMLDDTYKKLTQKGEQA